MGGCWSGNQTQKPASRERVTIKHVNSKQNPYTTPIGIDGSQNFSELTLKLGTTPTDKLELEQQQLRHIISLASKDFIDVSSTTHSPFYLKEGISKTYSDKIVHAKLPKESKSVFSIPKASNALIPASSNGIPSSEIDQISSCTELLSQAFYDMKVKDCGEIVVSFD